VIGTHLQECTLAHIISRITSAVTRHSTGVTKITRHSCIRHHTLQPRRIISEITHGLVLSSN